MVEDPSYMEQQLEAFRGVRERQQNTKARQSLLLCLIKEDRVGMRMTWSSLSLQTNTYSEHRILVFLSG